MVQKIKRNPMLCIAVLVALVLAVGVLTFAGPCIHDDGTTSMCFGASQVILACGVVGAICAAVALLVPQRTIAAVLAFVAAAAGAVAAIAPGNALPLCMMQTMRCWTTMKPFSMVVGAILLVCALIGAIVLLRSGKGRSA